jgi:hypothetical protein
MLPSTGDWKNAVAHATACLALSTPESREHVVCQDILDFINKMRNENGGGGGNLDRTNGGKKARTNFVEP